MMNRHFKEWFVMASISVGIFVVGLAGVIGLSKGKVMTIGKERSKLVQKNIELKSKIYQYMSDRGHLNIDTVREVKDLKAQIREFEKQIDAQPDGESGRTERNRIYDEMQVVRDRLWDIGTDTVQDFIQLTPRHEWPRVAEEYQWNIDRIKEIDNMGWMYRPSGRLMYTILGFLSNTVMVIGALCTLLFGVFGFMGYLGTIDGDEG